MEKNKIAEEIAAAAKSAKSTESTESATNMVNVPDERIMLGARMYEIGAATHKYVPSTRRGGRGTIGLFDETGVLLETWMCSAKITAVFESIFSDKTLTPDLKGAKALNYAYTLQIMWVNPQGTSKVFQMLGESRDFSNAFEF